MGLVRDDLVETDDEMPKKNAPPEDPAKQYERFKEAAEKIGADSSGKEFERAFGMIVPPLRSRKNALDNSDE